MKEKIQGYINSLSEIFEGDPWYGNSVMRKLENVPHVIGFKTCVPDSHTTAEIVMHLIQWKKFALEKLKGNESWDIEVDSENDWPKIRIDSKDEWEGLKRKLVSAQQKIYEFLQRKDDDFLDTKVPGRDYDCEYLIRGIMQHDIYHLGQIGLIGSQLEKNDSKNHTGVFNLKE